MWNVKVEEVGLEELKKEQKRRRVMIIGTLVKNEAE